MRVRPESPSARDDGSSGSGLLVVLGATAALAVMAQLLLLAAATARAGLEFQLDRRQAAELARGSLAGLAVGLRSGSVPLPTDSAALDVTASLAPIPAPPGGSSATARPAWPRPTTSPPAPGTTSLGRGRRAVLRRVSDPYGVPRRATIPTPDGDRLATLLEARVTAWFRRAHVEVVGRFLVSDDRLVRRID